MSAFMLDLFSQNPFIDLDNAQRCFNEYGKNKTNQSILDSAKFYIDRAVEDPDLATSGLAYNYRGAIYKELYKARENNDFNSSYRARSVEYFLRSNELDTTTKNREIVKQQIKWLAIQFNNDAKKMLEREINIEAAEKSFKEFCRLILIYDTNFNIRPKEIEFQLACGSALQEKAQNAEKKEFYDLAKVAYFRVLDMDSTNNDANYNLGIIYYNQGANLIMKVLDFDTPIDSISIFDDMAKKFFTQAKPYMLKASKKPNCMKVIEGLMGIYYSLNDDENYKKIKEIFDKIKSDIDAGLVKEEC